MKIAVLMLCLIFLPNSLSRKVSIGSDKIKVYVRTFGIKKLELLEKKEGVITEGVTKTTVTLGDFPPNDNSACEILSYIKVTVKNEKQKPRVHLLKSAAAVQIEYLDKKGTNSGYRIESFIAKKVRCDETINHGH